MSKAQRALKLFNAGKLLPLGLARVIRNAQRTDPNAAQGVTYRRSAFVPDQIEQGRLAAKLAADLQRRIEQNGAETQRSGGGDT